MIESYDDVILGAIKSKCEGEISKMAEGEYSFEYIILYGF